MRGPAKAAHCSRALLFTSALVSAHTSHAQASPSSFTTGYRYDAEQRIVGTIAPDPDGSGPLAFAAVRNTYDGDGRLTRVETGELANWQSEAVAPSAWTGFTVVRTVDYAYDADGRRTKETLTGSDGVAQSVTQTSYDPIDRPVCVAIRMDPAQWAAQTDACIPQTSGANGPDRITKTLYLQTGNVDRIQKAFGTGIQQDYVAYTYTATNRVATVTDANQNLARYTYDNLDRFYQWFFPSPSQPGVASTTDYEQYGYDNNGNRTSLKKRDGFTLTYQYDALDRLKVKVVPDRSGLDPHLTTGDVYYGYDNRGLMTYADFDNTPNEGVSNTYDSAGRLTSSTTTMFQVSRTIGYQYDADGNRTRITHPDGHYYDTVYDGLDRPDTASLDSSGSSFLNDDYNSSGLLSARGIVGVGTGFGYDGAGRLNSETQYFPTSTNNVTQTFSYNSASQIIGTTRDNDAFVYGGQYSVNRAYAKNGLNQYTQAGPDALQYDANGNLTSDTVNGVTTTYGYDMENRLVWASGPAMALYYDPLGRLWRTSTSSGTVNRFLYDGDKLVAEYNGDSASASMTKRYFFGSGVDQPLIEYSGSGTDCSASKFLQADNQGSIIAQSNCSGDRTQVNTYDEYGINGATNEGRFQYTGQLWMPEVGLYYYKARMYSPTLGRFMQTDPIGYKDQMNLYEYVGDDPMNGTDPSGERWSLVGSPDEKTRLWADILAVARADERLWQRFNAIRDSQTLITVGFTQGNEDPYTHPVVPINATNGKGSDALVHVKLNGERDIWHVRGRPFTERDIVAHEVFGHAYDDARGRLDNSLDRKNKIPISEERAVRAENAYRTGVGEPVRTTYGPAKVTKPKDLQP